MIFEVEPDRVQRAKEIYEQTKAGNFAFGKVYTDEEVKERIQKYINIAKQKLLLTNIKEEQHD